MGRYGRGAVAVVAIAAVSLTACSDDEDLKSDLSFCEVYAKMVGQRAAVDVLDPKTLDAGEASDVAEAYLDSVKQLNEVTDDRYGMQIFELDAAVSDLVATLDSVDPDENYLIWAPLVEDDLEQAQDLAAVLDRAIGPFCDGIGS